MEQTRTFLSAWLNHVGAEKDPDGQTNTGRGKNERLQPKSLYLVPGTFSTQHAASLDDESAESLRCQQQTDISLEHFVYVYRLVHTFCNSMCIAMSTLFVINMYRLVGKTKQFPCTIISLLVGEIKQ
jgi:hypothetical protein